MSEQHQDSPYLDDSSRRHSKPSRSSTPAASPRERPSSARSHSAPRRPDPRPNGASSNGAPSKGHSSNGNGRTAHAHAAHPGPAARPAPRKRSRRRGGNGTYRQPDELTSHPTTRNAYVETREWLLRQHGPICAYCGVKFASKLMTLDHVAPRRGQTAYDRRDNLVLACQGCNAAKRDLAPLAFLLGVRARARNLVRFGAHLSEGLIEMARSLIPVDETNSSGAANIDHDRWGEPVDPGEDSPYKD